MHATPESSADGQFASDAASEATAQVQERFGPAHRIALLTPGTGSFFCGSCLRDNALGHALLERGHDAHVTPLYLPFVLEETEPAARSEVQLGGINVWLQDRLPLLRFLPGFAARALDRPGLLRWASRRANMTSARDLGRMTVSMVRGDHGRQRHEIERLAEFLTHDRPDVIVVSNVLLIGILRLLREATGARIVCSMQGEAPFLDSLPEPFRSQAWNGIAERAADVDAFVPVSRWYGEHLAQRLELDPARLHVVHNGIDPAGFPPQKPAGSGAPTLAYVARMCPDKGLHTLVEAFCQLAPRFPQARLEVLGVELAEDRAYVAQQRARLASAGLTERSAFFPNATRAEKLALLARADVLSVPATYGESFGLYLLEAFASGVPVVQPRCAAFPELLEASGAGLLVEPDDASDLARGLSQLLEDPEQGRALGRAGRSALEQRFTTAHMAQGLERVIAALVPPAATR